MIESVDFGVGLKCILILTSTWESSLCLWGLGLRICKTGDDERTSFIPELGEPNDRAHVSHVVQCFLL